MENSRAILAIIRQVLATLMSTIRLQEIEMRTNRNRNIIRMNRNMNNQHRMHVRRDFRLLQDRGQSETTRSKKSNRRR